MINRRPIAKQRFRTVALAAAVAVGVAGPAAFAPVAAEERQAPAGGAKRDVATTGASLNGIVTSATLASPAVLNSADADRYSRIFALQHEAQWRAADREIVQLENRLLMGHVLFQRYMHPTGYRSKYVELKTWLDAYADHPGAYRVYRLALKRQPSGYKSPRRPRLPKSSYAYADMRAVAVYRSERKRSRATWREVRRAQRQIRNNLRNDRITVSEKYLNSPSVQRLLDPVEQDELRAKIAAAWFYYGNSERAYELAAAAAERSRAHVSHADWIAGLAA